MGAAMSNLSFSTRRKAAVARMGLLMEAIMTGASAGKGVFDSKSEYPNPV